MEKRELNISFNKSGRGSMTPKMALPMSWIKGMGINENDRKVEVVFENDEIKIKRLNK